MIKRTFIIILGLAAIFALNFAQAQDPQKAKMTSAGTGYLEYLPADYSSTTKLYPAIIFLHGAGERGTGAASALEIVKKNGPPNLIKNGNKMCFTVNGKTECFIVLSPQTNEWAWGNHVIPFVKYALANYRIDPNRVYVTGLSMGGQGTWQAASFADNAPNYFAAMAPMSAKGTLADGTSVASKKIAVWAFHGDADHTLSLDGGTLPITGMRQADASPAPKFTIYPGAGHSQTWVKGYTTDHSVQNPNVYEWFLMQTKGSSPVQSSLSISAGADQTITLPVATATLTAAPANANGTVVYTWSKISGPNATLTNANTQKLTIASALEGTYTFRVTAHDSQNKDVTDDVVLTVKAAVTNLPPIVSAGTNQTIDPPANSTTFTAKASDPDGTITSYSWSKIGGGSISMSGNTTASLKVTNAVGGTYVFQLQVLDNKGAKSSAQVSLKVNTAAASPLTVTAGGDQTITLPSSTATFTAIPANMVGNVTYSWIKISGPNATLTNTTSQKLNVSQVLAGTYTFRATVTDTRNVKVTDDVNLIVKASSVNVPPVVNAGAEQIINLPTNYATFTANASDSDGSIASYIWTKIGGGGITMSGDNTATLKVSNAQEGAYNFKVQVTDNKGAVSTSTVTLKVNGVLSVNAGSDKTITLPSSTASFTATPVNSAQTVLTYEWTKTGGGTITMSGTTSHTLTLSNAQASTYTFMVKVTNSHNQTATDYVQLKVNPSTSTAKVMSASSVSSKQLIADNSTPEYPLSLGQNYPNPFTASSTIPFSLDKGQHVTLKVFDATGNEVTTVLNEDLEAGNHAAKLSASALPVSGVYYCKLITQEKVITTRMVLVL